MIANKKCLKFMRQENKNSQRYNYFEWQLFLIFFDDLLWD